MTAACAANGVQFMDGVMYMHSDRMPLLRGILDDSGNLGDIKRISSAFSFCAPPDFFEGNIRSSGDLEPAGALGDLGWYTIRASLFVLNYEMPIALQARRLSEIGGENSTDPVPTELSGELFFSNGVTASFYNSFLTDNQQWLHVSGTAGQLRVDDFVLPFPGGRSNVTVSKVDAKQDGCLFVMQNEDRILGVEEAHGNDGNSQETKLFRTFARLALGCQPDEFWPEIALKTQRVMDACMASMRADGKRIELTNHKSGFGA